MDEHLEKRIGHSVLSNVLNAFISQRFWVTTDNKALITETDQYSKANVSCWQVRGSYHWVQLTCGSIRQLILVVSKWGDSSMPKGPLSPGTDCSLFCEGRDEFCLKDRQLCGLILGDLEPRNDTFPRYPNPSWNLFQVPASVALQWKAGLLLEWRWHTAHLLHCFKGQVTISFLTDHCFRIILVQLEKEKLLDCLLWFSLHSPHSSTVPVVCDTCLMPASASPLYDSDFLIKNNFCSHFIDFPSILFRSGNQCNPSYWFRITSKSHEVESQVSNLWSQKVSNSNLWNQKVSNSNFLTKKAKRFEVSNLIWK